ncbi:MAG TPA: hypothetical protein DCW42_03020 [Bacteroidetes bacterium]|nr:hypothetical protein [Bacteroidota bacterium]
MKKLIIFLITSLITIYAGENLFAYQSLKNSYELEKYEIITSDNQAIVNFSIKSKIDADYKFFIDAPKSMKLNKITEGEKK